MRVLDTGVSEEATGAVGVLWGEEKLSRLKVEYFCCFPLHQFQLLFSLNPPSCVVFHLFYGSLSDF